MEIPGITTWESYRGISLWLFHVHILSDIKRANDYARALEIARLYTAEIADCKAVQFVDRVHVAIMGRFGGNV